jgi:hypothetical protein
LKDIIKPREPMIVEDEKDKKEKEKNSLSELIKGSGGELDLANLKE